MQHLSFPAFLWHTGLTGEELFQLLVLSSVALFVLAVRRNWIPSPRAPAATTRFEQVMVRLSTVGLLAVVGFFLFTSLHTRYLLRPGAGRYLPGEVYAYGQAKGGKMYWYRYRVAGGTYENHTFCADREVYPPLGTRYYILYSLAEPAVSRSTNIRVPDTLQYVPSLGWGRLPAGTTSSSKSTERRSP
ncbi:hypothetical protein [Hymenobacter nivis]|uniref:Uncharacterized protein n=1 Tax=Hymenobacter nivis TaxID=1850093 RepID=A0A502GVR6_9BACT|nr:hypothetical protein [Hymenobacter nivis]TPG65320.1 hypothetical protein EAH73_12605 [Hymenobacter nivis]